MITISRKDLLIHRIKTANCFTALEKRYLISLVEDAPEMVEDKSGKETRTRWIKDFKNSVMCPSCNQQFNWESYDQSQDEFISENPTCPLCGAVNVLR
jgi:rubredoxin